MNETNAERLRRLKGLAENNYFVGCPGDGTEFQFSEEVDWLIGQAELGIHNEQALINQEQSSDKEIERLRTENNRLRKALEFYALGRHWITSLKDGRDYVNEYGELAEKVLEESK